MAQNADNWPPVTNPRIGLAVCSRYTDGNWYRAEIVELKDADCSVKYVDFGNKETKPVNELVVLPEDYLVLPAVAILCDLHNVEPYADIWTAETIKHMMECLMKTKEPFFARIKESGSPCKVDLLAYKLEDGEPVE